MNPGILLLFAIALLALAAYFLATIGDVNQYMNPKTRRKVVEQLHPGMTRAEVTRVYLKVNARELVLFLGGMFVGAVMLTAGGMAMIQ